MAEFLAQQGRYDEAFEHIGQAIAVATGDPHIHISKAKVLNAIGRAEEAEEAARWALRLDPRVAPDYLRALAVSLFHQKRYAEAAETIRRVISRKTDFPQDYATLIASLGHLGQIEEIPELIKEYNGVAVPAYFDPLTVQEMGWWWYGDRFNYYAEYRDALMEGLRKAGVPEGGGTDLAWDDYMRLISRNQGEYSVDRATKIDAATAKELLDRGGVTFIDVRAPLEYSERHVPGAANLDVVTDLSRETLGAVAAPEDEIAFYCHGKHCPYSAYASAKAIAWGYSRVFYFAGGFPAWHDAGYPIEGKSTGN
jgi:rhodanese-related sulfurtransferase